MTRTPNLSSLPNSFTSAIAGAHLPFFRPPAFTCLLISDYSFGSGESPSNYDAPLIPNASANNPPPRRSFPHPVALALERPRQKPSRFEALDSVCTLWERRAALNRFDKPTSNIRSPTLSITENHDDISREFPLTSTVAGTDTDVGHENFAPLIGNWGFY